MNRICALFGRKALLLALTLLLPLFVSAQDQKTQAQPQQQQQENSSEGLSIGNYAVKQAAEFGYRNIWLSGSGANYGTMVNLRDGARLLDYSLELRSMNHHGSLFDNFWLTNSGYGGDPNNVTRVRMYKNKWYNFNAMFRRDYLNWNYDLLANPLNPAVPTINPPAPTGFSSLVVNSPHDMFLVRRMSDFNLTVLPQSAVRFRLGYNRNINEGPSFTTLHEGTEALLLQNWKTTVNAFTAGVDVKLLPRTNISFDEIISFYKGDPTRNLSFGPFLQSNGSPFTLSNGTPVSLGVPINIPAGQPCAAPFNAAPNLGTVYAGCPLTLGYNWTSRPRQTMPIEQLAIQSNYFQKLDVSARVSYSASNLNDNSLSDFFDGSISRSLVRQFTDSGPSRTRRVSVTADGAATYHVTEKLRVTDTFRFSSFRLPGNWDFLMTNSFAQGPLLPAAPPPASQSTLNRPNLLLPPGIFDSTNCPSPFTANTCPQHNTSSPADATNGIWIRYLAQDSKINTAQVEYDFNRRFGVRAGFRYGKRLLSDFDATDYTSTGLGETYFPGANITVKDINNNNITISSAFRGDCAPVSVTPGTPPVIVLPTGCSFNAATGVVTWVGVKQENSKISDPLSALGRDSEELHEYSGLFGLWARPTDNVRISLDTEILSADNTFVRIAPRQRQHVKARVQWKPVSNLTIGVGANFTEQRNNVTDINHLEHNRSYSIATVYEPNDRFMFDFGLDYNNVFSSTVICYNVTSIPAPSGTPPCPNVVSAAPLKGTSLYLSRTLFTHVATYVKPTSHVQIGIGGDLTRVNGDTTFLSPIPPLGSLHYAFYRPFVSLDVQVAKGMTWKTKYEAYDYHERALPDTVSVPRNFKANMITSGFRLSW